MPTRVSCADLSLAADWLEINDGEDGEMTSCHSVAKWLREEVVMREREMLIRELQKNLGWTRMQAAKALKAKGL